MIRIDLHPIALKELKNAANWYSRRSPIAGQRFAVAIEEAMKKIADAPERFVKLDRRYRACPVMGFPYRLIFRLAAIMFALRPSLMQSAGRVSGNAGVNSPSANEEVLD